MVSADNVNYDVLTLIFAFLGNNDLVSASLVSKSFKAGTTPRLYRSIYFKLGQMKRWPKVASPFSVILNHPGLGMHVRSCDIKAVPKLKGQPHPLFMSDCAEGLALCPNLVSFTCLNDVPPFLSLLPPKGRLTELKLHAALGTEQAKVLTRLDGLHSLALYQASLSICHSLSTWIPTLAKSLTSLTITNSPDFNEIVLESTVSYLSHLYSLHVTGCPKVSHQILLRLAAHTPVLESLSFTTWENPTTSLNPPTLSLLKLQHLSVDTRCSFSPHSVPSLYNSIFTAFAASPLRSLTFKLSERMVVGDTFIQQIVDNHGATLVRLNAVNVDLTEHSIETICSGCDYLEQLSVVIPAKHELDMFSDALSFASSLHTLIDVSDSHSVHGPRATLSATDVREIFRIATTLKTIISGNRRWTCERIPIYVTDIDNYSDDIDYEDEIEDYEIKLKLDRLKHSSNITQHLLECAG
ncbi:hypothetical protein K439DRAFT_1630508 [Ramaria rubella]|nr:hypothetical protein K439DRAFT_1630508 [Ramaria rubella]